MAAADTSSLGVGPLLSRAKRAVATVAALLLAASLLASCSSPAPEPKLVLNPAVQATRATAGNLYARDMTQAISPDGKFILVEQRDKQAIKMVAMPLDSEAKDVVFTTIDPDWASNNYVWLPPIGWTSSTQCIYLVSGWQNQGPHKDKRGISVMMGDTGKGAAEEAAFIDMPGGDFREAMVVAARSKVYLWVSGALWEFDYSKKALRQVVAGLPTYDGLFNFEMSPTGEYAVYDLHEADRNGLYILDIATGKERPLLPTGETMSFLPRWSPDGKHVVAYTVDQKPDAAQRESWDKFEVYQGEDGPMPIASQLTILDPQGAVVKTVRVEGRQLMYATWAQDSKTLGFFTATAAAPQSGAPQYTEGPSSNLTPEGAMLRDFTRTDGPVLLCTLNDLPDFRGTLATMYPSFVEPAGKGMFFTAFNQEKSQLLYASNSKAPVKIADGTWLYSGLEPRYDDYIFGVVSTGTKSTAALVGAAGSKTLMEFDSSMSQMSVLGYTKDLLVVVKEDYPAETGTLTVYKMYSPESAVK